MADITNPYIDAELTTTIALQPEQLNNEIYINLKKNLKTKLLNKCYKNYGLITEIHEMTEYKKGFIVSENFTGSVLFDISFSCRLCSPIKGSIVLCEVSTEREIGIIARNGMLITTITNDRMSEKFVNNQGGGKIKYKENNGKYTVLQKGDVIVVVLVTIEYDHGSDRIKSLGFLVDRATEEQTELFRKQHKEREKEQQEDDFGDYE